MQNRYCSKMVFSVQKNLLKCRFVRKQRNEINDGRFTKLWGQERDSIKAIDCSTELLYNGYIC